MSGYQMLCQWVTAVHGTHTAYGAEQEQDLNTDSLTELIIIRWGSGKLDRKYIFLFGLKKKKIDYTDNLDNRNAIVLKTNPKPSMQTVWRN